VVKTVTHEEVSSEELGSINYSTKSGVTHLTALNDGLGIIQVKSR